MKNRVTFVRRGGRVAFWLVSAAFAGILAWEALTLPFAALWREPVLPALVVAAAWMLWVAPRVDATPTRLTIRNTWLTHTFSWDQVQGFSRRFGLRVIAANREVAASAAPGRSAIGVGLGPRRYTSDHGVSSYRDYEADPVVLSPDAAEAATLLGDYRADALARPDAAPNRLDQTRPTVPTYLVLVLVAVYAIVAWA